MYRLAPLLIVLLFAAICLAPACQNDPPATEKPQPEASFFVQIDTIVDQNGQLSVTFDRIEFLTGDAAVVAAKKAGEAMPEVDAKGDTTWWTANDYYIVNPDSSWQTLDIAPDASVQLIDMQNGGGSGSMKAKTSDLPGNEQLRYFPFELTTKNGKVVALRAQFVP